MQNKNDASPFLSRKRPDFWIQMLLPKKIHRESLFLDDKVQILKNDAAAHKKQQESLSPGDKVQILNNDAAAHKQKQESLSPDNKVQI
jgi:hypothetical protein